MLFHSAILTARDDKPAENVAVMAPEIDVITLPPGSVSVLGGLPGRTIPYETVEIHPQVDGIIIRRSFVEGNKIDQDGSLYQVDPAPLWAELNSTKGSLAKALSTTNDTRITFNHQALLLKTSYISR